MNLFDELIKNEEIFFRFVKEKYPLIEKSNIFFRDIQFAIVNFFDLKGIEVKYGDAEQLVLHLTAHLEKEGKLTPVNRNAWKVNFSMESKVISEELNEVSESN